MLKIETWENNPILRTLCEPVKTSEWKQYVKIGKEMVKYIKSPKHGWVWLAAPQVGITKRFIVTSLPQEWDDEVYPTILMINPVILEESEESMIWPEGCLSLPKTKSSDVVRAQEVKVKYFDEKMKEKIIRVSWAASIVVQHEIDHLNGVLIVDKLVK